MTNEQKQEFKKLVQDFIRIHGPDGENTSAFIRSVFNDNSDPEFVGLVQQLRWASSSVYAACLGYITKHYGKVDVHEETYICPTSTTADVLSTTRTSNSTINTSIPRQVTTKPIPKTTNLNDLASMLAKSLKPDDLAKLKGDK